MNKMNSFNKKPVQFWIADLEIKADLNVILCPRCNLVQLPRM